MTKTNDIRAKLAVITAAVSDIATLCNDIDGAVSPPSPPPPPPPVPTIPTAVNCLAGTTPPSTNMIAAEASETAWINARATFRTTMKNSASGSILCIGDSQIAHMDVSQISPYAVNLGISGESSRQLLYRINETDIDGNPNLIHRAGAVVIETFVNDMGDQATYSTAANAYGTIRDFMLPRLAQWVSGKVVIICPTKLGTNSPPFWTSNTAIEDLNTLIKSTFASRSDVRVIDINPTIAPSGLLLAAYDSGDHHHLNAAGYTVKANAVKAALISLGV